MLPEPDHNTGAFRLIGGLIYALLLSMFFIGPGILERLAHPGLLAEARMDLKALRYDALVINVRFHGASQRFLVDTGSTVTLIDNSLTSKLAGPMGKSIVAQWYRVTTNEVYLAPEISLDGEWLEMAEPVVYAIDIARLYNSTNVLVKGILGMDVLQHYCVQLDFAAGKLYLLDGNRADRSQWGQAQRLIRDNPGDPRPMVAENLLGLPGPSSLIDTGINVDGWLRPEFFREWTNQDSATANTVARSPDCALFGERYPIADLVIKETQSDGIGLSFLARHLVTFDFPNQMLYLRRESFGPSSPYRFDANRVPGLDRLVKAVLLEDKPVAQAELRQIEISNIGAEPKRIARKLTATLDQKTKPTPAEIPAGVTEISLGDCRTEEATVGWLAPTANRLPLNWYFVSPYLDSGKVYATGLFAPTPARYVYRLDGKWDRLRGAAGLHTAVNRPQYAVQFYLKADGRVIYQSARIHGDLHADYNVDVHGVKTLELLTADCENRPLGDLALWLEPTLIRKVQPDKNPKPSHAPVCDVRRVNPNLLNADLFATCF